MKIPELTWRTVQRSARHTGNQSPDSNRPCPVRVRAAEIIANHSHKAIEIEDVEARVTALEEAAADEGKR